jgi:hypothetical protein
MTDDIEQWLLLARVLFYVCSALVLIVAILSFLAYHRVTHGQRILELIWIWGAAASGSVIGSILVGILGYYLAEVNYPNTNESGAALVGAAFGMIFSIPIGIVGGGLAGTMSAALLVYLNSWRPTLIASASALVMGTLSSGVALVPIGFVFFGLGHI